MRKLAAAIIAAIVLTVVVVAAYATSAFQRRLEATAETLRHEIAERSRLEARFAGVHARWFPTPAAVIDDVVVTTRKAAGSTPVVEHARVVAVPRLGALLTGHDDLQRIEVQNARFVTRPDEKESAIFAAPLLRAAPAPVALRDCSIAVDRGPNLPLIEAQHVDLDLTPHEGTVDFRGTMAPLGERSHADVSGTWRPGVGRTGGDAFKIDLKVRNGDPSTLVAFAEPLKRATFTDDVTLDLAAEGFLGERTTEVMPAEPLAGRMHLEVGIDLLGVKHRAIFDNGVALDDKRWVLRDGKGKWGERPFTFAGWIARAPAANKVNLRLSFEHVDAAAVMAEYAIDERWRPQADLSGEIRMEGSFDYPLTRYEAKMPSFTWNAWPSMPLSSGPMSVRGSLIAINTDVSATFETNELKVGTIVMKNVLVGTTWWHEKLTITSMNLPMWGGKMDASAAYEPAAEERWKGGALLHDLDAAVFVPQAMPDSGLRVEGRLDGSGDGGYRGGAWWYRGRVGLHEGTLGPQSLLRAVASEVVKAAGADPAVLDELATRHPALASDKLAFKRTAIDFQAQPPGTALRIGDLVSDGGTLTLEATADATKHVAADGLAVFVPPVSADLAGRIPALARLLSSDRSLQVPVHAEGAPADLKVSLRQDFVDALAQALKGKSTGPFSAEKPKPSFELEGLQPLDEQFGR